jgi:hypothetical protein
LQLAAEPLSVHDLLAETQVILGAVTSGAVSEYVLAAAWSLGQSDILTDDRFEE